MLKILFNLLIFTCCLFQTVYSQSRDSYNYRKGYLVKENSYSQVELAAVNGKEYLQCIVKNGDGIVVYGPDEVSEYGFNRGAKFIAKSVIIDGESKLVFLERFYYDKISLYYLRYDKEEYFFTDNGGSEVLTKITDENKFDIFSSLPYQCNSLDEIKLDRKSMMRFMDCTPPAKNIILSAGIGSFSVKKFPNDRDDISNPNVFDKTGDIFTISLMHFSQIRKSNYVDESNFHFGFGLQAMSYSFENIAIITGSSDGALFTNSSQVESCQLRISIPLILKYSKNFDRLGVFGSLGLGNSYSFNEVVVTSIRTFDGIETSRTVNDFVPSYQLGFSAGVGLTYRLNDIFGVEASFGGSSFVTGEFQTSENFFGLGFIYSYK